MKSLRPGSVMTFTAKQGLILKPIPPVYDFDNDPTGEVTWQRKTSRTKLVNLRALSVPAAPRTNDVHKTVVQKCKRFKELTENNELNSFCESNWRPKHEFIAQKLFYGIADSYSRANDLHLIANSQK